MASSNLQGVLKSALSDLDGIVTNLAFLSSATKVVAVTGGITQAVAGDATLRSVVLDFKKNSIDDFNTLYQSLYVQVFASYESFIRGLVQAYVDQVSSKDKTYEKLKLRNSLLDRNTYHTGFALQQVLENRTNVTLDFDALVKNLFTAKAGSDLVTLNSVAFTLMLGTLRPDGIIEALKRVGQSDKAIWDRLGAVKEIQQHFNLKTARETAKAIDYFLTTSIKRRNSIVHKGEGIQAVSESDVLELIEFFKVFFAAFTDYLTAKI